MPVISVIVIGLATNKFNDYGGLVTTEFTTNPGDGGSFCFLTNYHPPNCVGLLCGVVSDGFTISCGRRGGSKSAIKGENHSSLITHLMPTCERLNIKC